MQRRHYLVTYDVSNDKRRNRVFKLLHGYGNHTQYSVFLCELNPPELATLRSELQPIVHGREDQVLLVDLGPAEHELDMSIDSVGRAFQPVTRAFII